MFPCTSLSPSFFFSPQTHKHRQGKPLIHQSFFMFTDDKVSCYWKLWTETLKISNQIMYYFIIQRYVTVDILALSVAVDPAQGTGHWLDGHLMKNVKVNLNLYALCQAFPNLYRSIYIFPVFIMIKYALKIIHKAVNWGSVFFMLYVLGWIFYALETTLTISNALFKLCCFHWEWGSIFILCGFINVSLKLYLSVLICSGIHTTNS